MSTISAKVIAKPRKIRFCEGYRHFGLCAKNVDKYILIYLSLAIV